MKYFWGWLFGFAFLALLISYGFFGLFVGILSVFAGLFVFGSFWFWVLMVLSAGFIIYSVDEFVDFDPNERDYSDSDGGHLAFFTLVATVLLLNYFGDFHVFRYIIEHPWKAALQWGGGYVLAGLVIAAVKWLFHVYDLRYRYKKQNESFCERNNIVSTAPVPQRLVDDWNKFVGIHAVKPLVKKNMGRLTIWAVYWPWVLVWSFLFDFLKRFYRFLVKKLQYIYQAIADYVWRDVEADAARMTGKNKETGQ